MKILVFCLPGIGDSLMATPMIKHLRKKHPDAIIDVVCMFEGVRYVFENNPHIDTVHRLFLYKENVLYAFRQLLNVRKNNYDVSILAFPSYRKEYHVVQWVVGAKKRIAHQHRKGYITEGNFLDSTHIPVDEAVHNVVNNMNLLHGLDIHWEKELDENKLTYDLLPNKKDTSYGKKYVEKLGWGNKKVVGIHPGSTVSKAALYKRWSVNNYQTLIKRLIDNDCNVLIFSGNDEIDVALDIEKRVGDRKHCQLVRDVNFGQSIGIVSTMDMMICNDNGFAHIANGLNVPSVVLFGPTNPNWCSPYNKKYARIIRKATFEPWFRNDMKVTHPPKDVESGMDEITVNDVLQEIKKIYGK